MISEQEALTFGRYGGFWTQGTVVDIQSVTLDNTAVVDNSDGTVDIAITGHPFAAGQYVLINGTTNYEGTFLISDTSTNAIEITATYNAETPAGTETAKVQNHITIGGDTDIIRVDTDSRIYIFFDTTSDTNNSIANNLRLGAGAFEIYIPRGLRTGEGLTTKTIYFHVLQVGNDSSKGLRYVES